MQGRMQSLLIIDPFDKVGNSVFHILQGSILPKIDFFVFQGLDKTLRNRIVIGVPFPGHADLKPTAEQGMDVIVRRILNPPIRMMDDPGGRISTLQGPLQSLQTQLAVDVPGQTVADGLTGKEIQNHRQIDKKP